MPTVTSENKASFIQNLLNKYTPFGNTPAAPVAAPAAPVAPVRPADRWKAVPFGGVKIFKTDYSTGNPETQPTVFDSQMLEQQLSKGGIGTGYKESIEPSLLHAIYDATKIDRNLKFSPDDAVAMFAQEGRPDLGANYKDVMGGWKQNPRAVDLNERLRDMGYNEYDAGTAALMLDKQMTAARLSKRQNKNIPWQAVWNGLGQTKTGRTGYDYAREYGMNAKNVGANKEALEIIRRHMSEPR